MPSSFQQELAQELRELPTASVVELVDSLVRNEQFIAVLVNSEAFLDRLAGNESVVQELERRHDSAAAVEARRELAAELVRRQVILDELATRGPDAVVALADAAEAAIEQVGTAPAAATSTAAGPAKEGIKSLVQLETAMELVEDSEELMMAMEGKPMDAKVEFSGARKFKKMEETVAATEQALQEKLEQQGLNSETIKAEQQVQAAVRELFYASDVVAEDAIETVEEAAISINASEPSAAKKVSMDMPMVASIASELVEEDQQVVSAFDRVIVAAAELQSRYTSAVSNATKTVTGIEEAALQGVAKTKALVDAKKAEIDTTVEAIAAVVPPPPELDEKDVKLGSLAIPATGLMAYIAFLMYRSYKSVIDATPKPPPQPAGVQQLYVAPEPPKAKLEAPKAAAPADWRSKLQQDE